MARHFFSAKRRVTGDDCPKCGGHRLDPGKLATIRAEYVSEIDREKRFRNTSPPSSTPGSPPSTPGARAARLARKFAHALSFFCPSCYIPGKQEWGAFWLVGTSLLRCSATRKNPWPNVSPCEAARRADLTSAGRQEAELLTG
jgi:hypothetical protein